MASFDFDKKVEFNTGCAPLTVYHNYQGTTSVSLGVLQIIFGTGILGLSIALLAIDPFFESLPGYMSGAQIGCSAGAFTIAAGCLAIAGGVRKTQNLLVSLLTFTMVSLVTTGICIEPGIRFWVTDTTPDETAVRIAINASQTMLCIGGFGVSLGVAIISNNVLAGKCSRSC